MEGPLLPSYCIPKLNQAPEHLGTVVLGCYVGLQVMSVAPDSSCVIGFIYLSREYLRTKADTGKTEADQVRAKFESRSSWHSAH